MKMLKTSGHVEELRGVRNMHLNDIITHHSNSLLSRRICTQVSLRAPIFTPWGYYRAVISKSLRFSISVARKYISMRKAPQRMDQTSNFLRNCKPLRFENLLKHTVDIPSVSFTARIDLIATCALLDIDEPHKERGLPLVLGSFLCRYQSVSPHILVKDSRE